MASSLQRAQARGGVSWQGQRATQAAVGVGVCVGRGHRMPQKGKDWLSHAPYRLSLLSPQPQGGAGVLAWPFWTWGGEACLRLL